MIGRLPLNLRVLSLVLWLLPVYGQAGTGPVLRHQRVAACINRELQWHNPVAVAQLTQAKYQFHSEDLLLPYLALYSGVRAPFGDVRAVQDLGQMRWSGRWASAEKTLAYALIKIAVEMGPESLSLDGVIRLTHGHCESWNLFCSSLLLHNVLRTLGRSATAYEVNRVSGRIVDHNPDWYKENKAYWVESLPALDRALFPLSRNVRQERFGGWYHLSGIMAYGARLLAMHAADEQALDPLESILDINHYGNPFFTLGGTVQDDEGARRDQDVVQVLRAIARGPVYISPSICNDWGSLLR